MRQHSKSMLTRRSNQRGSVFFELGLVMPFLGLVALGMAHMGMALGDKQIITEAVRYGARRAAAEGRPICMGESSMEFEPCINILIEEDIKHFVGIRPEKGTEDPATLASYLACHSIAQAGLPAIAWKVKSEVVYDSQVPTVSVSIETADAPQIIQAFLKNFAKPKASATFVSQQTCPTGPKSHAPF